MSSPAGLTNLDPASAKVAAGKQTCGAALVEVIAQSGAVVVFGLPGGAISPLHDALLDRSDIRVVSTRHEAGAVFAAAAYARASGKPGFVLVTSGPGFFNALNGLASAWCDGLPVVLLVGEVARPLFGKKALQEGTEHHLGVVGMVRHLTKYAAQVDSAERATHMLTEAIAAAQSGRPGPVVLTLPVDVGLSPVAIAAQQSSSPPARPAPHDLHDVIARLEGAKRGAILAGAGALVGNGPAAIRELAERLQWPVMCTPKGKGALPETHPLSLGVCGHGGHPSCHEYLSGGIDALIVAGSSLGDAATDGWSPLLKCDFLVQIDVEASQIGRTYAVSHPIVGRVDEIAPALSSAVADRKGESKTFGVRRLSLPPGTSCITPHEAITELQARMPDATQFTCDIGEHLMFATHFLEARWPGQFAIMSGLGSMGTSIPAALGGHLAHPQRPVAAICGDGCFVMSVPDVVTAAHERAPIVIAVLNDFRYGMVELGHEQVYGRKPSYPLGPVDIAALARSAGADACVIETVDDFDRVVWPTAGVSGRPLVLDIRIDAAVRMPKSSRNKTLATK